MDDRRKTERLSGICKDQVDKMEGRTNKRSCNSERRIVILKLKGTTQEGKLKKKETELNSL